MSLRSLLLIPALCSAVSLSAAPRKLSDAALSGDLTQVKEVLKSNPDELNQIDKWGWTPLLWPTLRGYTPIVRYLLANGANPNLAAEKADIVIKAGATPLIIASYYGNVEMVQMLLGAKADPSKEDNGGETALTYAKRWNFQEVVDLLTKAAK